MVKHTIDKPSEQWGFATPSQVQFFLVCVLNEFAAKKWPKKKPYVID